MPPEEKRMIFYNIFVNPDGIDAAQTIVDEQFRAIKSRLPDVPIRYVLIDQNITSNFTTGLEEKCKNPKNGCTQIERLKTGDEAKTLQHLWEFCQTNPDVLVTYIHDKGSFHPSENNDNLRAMLTKSVLSTECQSLLDEKVNPNGCNVCGARFAPIPHWHFPGNMWTAKCSYIRKLHPLLIFPKSMEDMISFARNLKKREKIAMFPEANDSRWDAEWNMGTGRYASEHWVASHPDIQPCDVYPGIHYKFGYKRLPSKNDSWTPDLQAAPRTPFEYWGLFWGSIPNFYCGSGLLFQFQYLYHQKPPPESFIWSYFKNATSTCPSIPNAPTL